MGLGKFVLAPGQTAHHRERGGQTGSVQPTEPVSGLGEEKICLPRQWLVPLPVQPQLSTHTRERSARRGQSAHTCPEILPGSLTDNNPK